MDIPETMRTVWGWQIWGGIDIGRAGTVPGMSPKCPHPQATCVLLAFPTAPPGDSPGGLFPLGGSCLTAVTVDKRGHVGKGQAGLRGRFSGQPLDHDAGDGARASRWSSPPVCQAWSEHFLFIISPWP